MNSPSDYLTICITFKFVVNKTIITETVNLITGSKKLFAPYIRVILKDENLNVEVHDHLYDPVTVEQLKIYPIISN